MSKETGLNYVNNKRLQHLFTHYYSAYCVGLLAFPILQYQLLFLETPCLLSIIALEQFLSVLFFLFISV